jgi:transposase
MSELCARYGVSRRIGYKWLARYEADGRRGVVDRSHAPHHCPHKSPASVAELLITERRAHPFWGRAKTARV